MIMNRLTSCLFFGLVTLSLLTINACSEKSQNPPNIIFILTDDMGYGDVRAFKPESKIPTPHLDKLAESGMKFTDAHASGSSCITSRYGLLTGRYPFRAETLNWREEPLIEENRWTIASVLQKNGYRTGMVGKWHLGFDYSDFGNLKGGPVDRGFDNYYGISRSLDQQDYYYIEDDHAIQNPTQDIEASEGYGKNGWQGPFWRAGKAAKDFKHEEVLNKFTQKSVDFIENAANKSEPFFLYLALASPHTPWLISERFKGTTDVGDWGDWVAENDNAIGKVIQTVYDKGLKDNTLIIFTSDNGPVWWPIDVETYGHSATSIYRGMKFDAWEGGHRMPFIASWPGVINKESTSSQIISTTDMLATFAEIVGEQLPDNVGEDSYSILDVFYGKDNDESIHEAFVGRPDNTDLFIRKGEWKLIGKDRLYNLDADPSETTNVYKENVEIAADLLELLEKYKTNGRSTPLRKNNDLGVLPLSELIDVWDIEKIRARRPLLIAHRGGVVTKNAPECSKLGVKLAAAHKYDMVELDVRESKDHHPVVFHDNNMMKACGLNGKISDFTLESVTKIPFKDSEETITSLENMLDLCSSLNLGVMFDIKSGERSDEFFNRIIELIEKYDLSKSCMTLGDSEVRERLKGKVLLTLPNELLNRVKNDDLIDLHGYYWFGVPENWDLELVEKVQEKGALVIPALNTFRYSENSHRSEALSDAKRLLKENVDGFQIDCVYQDYFGRTKVSSEK